MRAVVDPERRRHILDGDRTGGGHRGGDNSRKRQFPEGDIEPVQGVRMELDGALADAAARIGSLRTAEIRMLLDHAEYGVALEHLASYLLLDEAGLARDHLLRLQRAALALGTAERSCGVHVVITA